MRVHGDSDDVSAGVRPAAACARPADADGDEDDTYTHAMLRTRIPMHRPTHGHTKIR